MNYVWERLDVNDEERVVDVCMYVGINLCVSVFMCVGACVCACVP